MGKVCINCGTTNTDVAEFCKSCGEILHEKSKNQSTSRGEKMRSSDNQNLNPPKEFQGSGLAAILLIFLIVFGVLLFIANFVFLFAIDGYNFWFFLLGIIVLILYFTIAAAIIELFDNVTLIKEYIRGNYILMYNISNRLDNSENKDKKI